MNKAAIISDFKRGESFEQIHRTHHITMDTIKSVLKEVGLIDKVKTCHEEFLEAYSEFPSQDTEGYIPDRGSFKTGWVMSWNIQQEKINKLEDKYFKLKENLKKLGE
ncbi:hypothetical protein N9948_00635 [bacterium]|nr:hypothetical protein [bacterium]